MGPLCPSWDTGNTQWPGEQPSTRGEQRGCGPLAAALLPPWPPRSMTAWAWPRAVLAPSGERGQALPLTRRGAETWHTGAPRCRAGQVRRQRFLWQSPAGVAEGAGGLRRLQFMRSTQPSRSCSTCLRPGGSGRPSRVSPECGRSWRRRQQHRYCREVALAQERITFMLLRAAVEHTIG